MSSKSPGKSTDGPEELPARENSPYAGERSKAKPQPRERGDYDDPVKRQTGRGNASKGPWEDQGGAGHGENYGARKSDPSGQDGPDGGKV
ncbi:MULTISPECIES: hypothetical protein [Rhodomicrobium]|uniref:hypothetical protein n=1 Tax=Rhodomicrobium TaxID=1068 RepID=UPI000F7381BA|nr:MULTISPECIES: hypothetical protein [Rhodomicrobium]